MIKRKGNILSGESNLFLVLSLRSTNFFGNTEVFLEDSVDLLKSQVEKNIMSRLKFMFSS